MIFIFQDGWSTLNAFEATDLKFGAHEAGWFGRITLADLKIAILKKIRMVLEIVKKLPM